MDSFFSLFDPADSAPRVKKERRRNRKNKNVQPSPSNNNALDKDAAISDDVCETEECAFLCEPQLSRHVRDTNLSYLDSYMELSTHQPNSTSEGCQQKEVEKKKRSNGRKSRRKKKSPPKEHIPRQCWRPDKLFYPEIYQERSNEQQVNWNNQQGAWSSKASVGKNVNNLTDTGKYKRAEPFDPAQADGDLTQCRILNTQLEEPLLPEEDVWAEEERSGGEASDGSASDDEPDSEDDSGDEVYGRLPPEPQFGNVEYKLQLVSVSDKKLQHLVTQLKWRLRSGGGSAIYVLGVRDCGALRGLRARALRASLRTLRKMAAALRAELRLVTSRQLAPHRAVAQVHIRKLADTQQNVELRVAVMGANDAGKSTLIGVLTQGELDNGRGSARLNMFRHLHEVQSGHTSSLSHEILGFDAQGNVVNYGCSELMTAERIGERSAKLVSFLDLAGHSKYQRTTVHGLTGYCPHYAALVVSATAGAGVGAGRMTEEHAALLCALDLPFFVVVTRTDLVPGSHRALLAQLRHLLAAAGVQRELKLITNEQQARCVAAPLRADNSSVAVFPVSCVTGAGLNVLHAHLLALEPRMHAHNDTRRPEEEACEFQIDEVFRAGEAGPVVGGLLASGVLREGDELLIGPMDDGEFVPMSVRSIYRNRVPCDAVRAGQSASLGLARRPARLRPGMVLLAQSHAPSSLDAENINKICDELQQTNELDKLIASIGEKTYNLDAEKNSLGSDVNVTKSDKNNLKDSNNNKNDTNNFKTDNVLKTDSNNLKTDGSNLKTDNNNLKTESNNLKTENNNLITDSNNLKTDNNNLKTDSNNLKTDNKEEPSVEVCWDVDGLRRKEKNVLRDLANAEKSLAKERRADGNLLRRGADGAPEGDTARPRGSLYFQATVRVLRHAAGEISPGFQATVHIGNIRQTAVIQGIMSRNSELCEGESAPAVFRFVRQPEYVRAGRKMLFRAGRQTCGVGHVTQVFPMDPIDASC